jgi:hypothetical protein
MEPPAPPCSRFCRIQSTRPAAEQITRLRTASVSVAGALDRLEWYIRMPAENFGMSTRFIDMAQQPCANESVEQIRDV